MHTILFHKFCPPKKASNIFFGLLFLSKEVGWFCSHFPGWLGLSIAKVLSSSLPVVPPSDALGLARPSPSPQDNKRMDRMVTWSFTSSCPILRLESCPCYLCWGLLICTFAFKTLMKKHTSHIFLRLARLARNKSCRNSGPPQPFCKAEHFEVAWVQSPASFLLPHVANSDPKKGNDGTQTLNSTQLLSTLNFTPFLLTVISLNVFSSKSSFRLEDPPGCLILCIARTLLSKFPWSK